MSNRYVSINGELVREEQANLHISDLSIQRGFGIFDFLKTINGKAVFLEDYLERFFNSIAEMNMEVSFSESDLKEQISALMEANSISESGIKILLTGGYSKDGYSLESPNLILTQTPFKLNDANFHKGCKLITYNHQRQLPTVKTIDYLQAIRLSKFINENLADDVLYHNNGQICECPRANFFVVIDKNIITPKSNVLRGITRKKLLGFKLEDYTILEQDFNLELLGSISEAFICSSTKNILHVLEIDGQKINNGTIGKVTTLLNQQLKQEIENYVN